MDLLDPIRESYEYLKYPFTKTYSEPPEYPLLYTLIIFCFAFFSYLFLMSLVGIFINLEEVESVFPEFEKQVGKGTVALIAVLAAPIIEEFIFRFPLRNKILLSCLLIGLEAMIISIVCLGMGWHQMALYLPLITSGISILMLLFVQDFRSYLTKTIENLYPYIFYFVAAMFAYAHIFNFSSGLEWWMTPFMVIPQFVLALYLGFIRMRINIWAAIFMHGLNNATILTMALLVSNLIQPN